jgi:aspartyl-tRNA(Asn)/glutamyl-tRNA(Gln) amidotransferase subunit C
MITCVHAQERAAYLFDNHRMSLDTVQVQKIALLARLRITAEEAQRYADSLSRILGLIEQMNAVNTDGVAPMAHPSESPLRLREDQVTEPNERDKFQAVAPAVEAGLYLVPKVIE